MPKTTTPPAADAVLTALAAHPGTTATELAADAGLGRSTVAKALATLEAEGKAHRTPGGRDGARRLPDRWDPVVADEEAERSKKDALPEPAMEVERCLGKGQLRAMVLEHLLAQPGQALSPAAIAKALGHSSGAIGNALRRLTETGEVVEVSQAPRRYSIPA